MNIELILKIAIVVFFTAAFFAFIYLFKEIGVFSSIKEFFTNAKYGAEDYLAEHRTHDEDENALENDEEWEEEKTPKAGFFQTLVYGAQDLYDDYQDWKEEREEKKRQRIPGISPKRVIALRNQQKGFTGVYIIYNYSKNMYYVGQAQNVYVRCSNHFLGKGNADIYADYKYGDEFFIEFVSLVNSGYDNLDDLERYYINRYDAVRRGYNRKRGNR